MVIRPIEPGTQRIQWMELLLETDPNRHMVERYLQRGIMLAAMEEDRVLGLLCAVRVPSAGWEIKNLYVAADRQNQEVDTALLSSLEATLPPETILWVGTGKAGVSYYEQQGFHFTYTLKNYFTRHYSQPILENGVPSVDKFYLTKKL